MAATSTPATARPSPPTRWRNTPASSTSCSTTDSRAEFFVLTHNSKSQLEKGRRDGRQGSEEQRGRFFGGQLAWDFVPRTGLCLDRLSRPPGGRRRRPDT